MRQVTLNIGFMAGLSAVEIAYILALQKEKMTMDQVTTASVITVIAFVIPAAINSILMFKNLGKYSRAKEASPKSSDIP